MSESTPTTTPANSTSGEQPMSIFNNPPKLLPGPALLHELMSWHSGNAPALEFLGPEDPSHPYAEKLWKASYAELKRCVAQLATQLHGVLSNSPKGDYLTGKQPIIPVLLPQSPGLYISQLATLQIGAAFCPINGDAPKERVKFICGDVGAKVVIAMRSDHERLTWTEEEDVTVAWVEDYFEIPSSSNSREEEGSAPLTDEPKPSSQNTESEANSVHDDGAAVAKKLRVAKTTDLAYIMYTSGSTGLPKGVGVSHLAVTQSLFAHDLFLPDFSKFLQFAAPSFDVSIFEIFFPLFKGKTLVGCQRQRLLNDLPGMINRLEVDGCELTPTVVNSLLGKRSAAPKLKLLLTIGEMLTRPVVDEFGYNTEEGRPGLLYGMYGPTEAAIHCTANCLMASGSRVGNIGVPFETVSCFIAAIPEEGETSTEIKVLPLGEVGELILGGPQLADGYLNREKENKAAFMTYNGERAYRTGDKGRMLSDGTIEVMGRISAGQVKLRGQRVELGEIEEVVYKQKGIKMAFASVLQGMLIVFASTKGEHVSLDDLNATCEKWLPKYMVPSELVVMQEFPYLPSGKINKKKLEADYLARRTEEDGKEEEEITETERTISAVVKGLLGLRVKLDKRLASYGLDSLMAIRLASQLKVKGLKITPVEILSVETVSAIASVCDANVAATPTEAAEQSSCDFSSLDEPVWNALEAAGVEDITEEIFPCTPLQDAMLLETAMDFKAYQNFISLRLEGSYTEGQLRDAIEKWADHNPILKTGFVDIKSEWSAYTQFVLQMLPESQIVIGDVSDEELSSDLSILRPLLIKINRRDSEATLNIHIHHALYDGWSLELLIADLSTILENPDKELVQRPSFRNVVEHELRLQEKDLSKETQYWSDHFSSLSPAPLPNFNSSTSVPAGLARASLSTKIETKKLEEVARGLEVSSQSLVQAAYSVLLSSYIGESDICFGTVFSGRTGGVDNIEDICGPTLSTLPVRIDTSSTTTMSSLAQALHSVVRKHLENDVLPLPSIKKLATSETQGRPLFDTLVVWQQTLETASPSDVKPLVELVKSEDQLEFALTLEVTPGKEGLRFDVTYQTDVLPEKQVRLLMAQVEGLVEAMIEMPELAVGGVAWKLDDELLSIANPEPEKMETPKSLSAAVEGMAVSNPDKTAVEFVTISESGEYVTEAATYRQLNERANQIADYLRTQNVMPDQLVAICMDKSTALYVSILGVIKAGAGYLPLTADTPVERIQTIIKDGGIKICIAAATTAAYLEDRTGAKIVDVATLVKSTLSTSNPELISSPENLAYAVFTSGSTGVPKGVLVNQFSVLANLETLKSVYPHSADTRLLQSCSHGFDVSVFEIFWTWTVGGTLVSGTKNTIFTDIEKLINDRKVTHLSLTSTVAALVNPANVPSVEVLIQAGEALTGKVFNAWAGLKNKRLFNAYGPSETTNVVTATAPIKSDDILSSIGKPLDTVSAFVLASNEDKDSPRFEVLPLGAEGELCYGGPQVARGYLDESQNAGKFVEHPVYGKIYRSGDYGRILPSREIIYSGRKDDQVKIRGQRVELGEISKMMLSSEIVDDCITLVIEGEKEEDRRLVTFSTLKDQAKTNDFAVLEAKKEVQERLFDKLVGGLPIYMVPFALIPVSTLPSTLVGKVDKKLLKQAFDSLSTEQITTFSNSTEPAGVDYEYTDLESQIANAVAEVAKLDILSIAPNASFFALGIDSISAISLVRLLREGGLKVEISDVLKHPSVLRLAKVIGSQQAKNKNLIESPTMLPTPEESTFDPEFLEATIDALEKRGKKVEQVLPCTPLQEAMLSASELSSESGSYKNQVTLDLKISVEQMENAWHEMVRRHEILRTVFVKSGHAKFAYSQVVLTEYEHRSRTLEAPSVVAAVNMAQEKDAEERTEGELLPPYTLLYVQQPWDGKTKLVLSMHHALYDGFAMSVLYCEIEAYLSGQKLQAAPSFAPFLRHMTGVDESTSDAHWISLLKDFAPVSFTNTKEVEKQNHRITAPLQVSLSTIEKQLKQHSTTLLSAVQAAWIATLSHTTKTTDLVFGNVVSGRTIPVPGLNDLVAPCFNTIPFRLNNIHKLSFLEAFRQLQAQNVDSLPYQLTALRRIQGLANTEGKSLFDSLVLLQTPSTPLNDKIWTVEEDEGRMDLPVVVEIVPHSDTDKLEVTVHVNGLPLGAKEVQDVLNTLETFLTKALENPRQQIIPSSAHKQTFSANTLALKNKKSATDETEGDKAWTATEEKVRDIIAKFTTVSKEDIKKPTSIYRLGLDSINAVQVATLLRNEGWGVAASDVLQFPSIAALSAHIGSLSSSEEKETVAEFDFASFEDKHKMNVLRKIGKKEEEEVEVINPCTGVQSGMLAQTLHSGGKEYVNSFCMELADGTDLQKMKGAWETITKACEMLRTGFVGLEDQQYPFAMVTYKDLPLPWKEVGSEAELADVAMDHKTLEQAPWMLEHFKRGDKDIIRFTAHHALYDAASLQLFLGDVEAAYEGLTIAPYTPIRSVIGPLLAANQGKEEEAKKFWTEEMTIHPHRFPDLTPLRVAGTKSFAQTGVSTLSLTEIEELAKQQGVSVQAAGQAAWGRLLSMYTGEPSVTFGVTLSGKSIFDSAENDRVAFPTIVTLPVSCDVVGDNKALLEASMKGNTGLSKWQFTPLTSIARWSRIEGAMFDTLFAYQKTAGEFDDEKKLWKVTDEDASADYVVSIEMLPTRDGKLELCVTAKENVVPREQAQLMLKQFDKLLVDTLRHADNATDKLEIDEKKEEILSITPPAQPSMGSEHMLLHDFVSRSASMYPNKTALEFTTCLEPLTSVQWSFSEMEAEANKIASLLQKLNVAQGQLVAICFDKCPEASWSIIGILKVGCAYVALDPGAPGDRVKFIMEDSKATIVLSSGKPAQNFTEIFADEDKVRIVDLDNCPELAECSTSAPKLYRAIDPQDTSYCLYTSGTTGTPKGCELTHENAVQAMYAFTYLFGDKTTESSKWLQFASFHFDVSVLEQFFAWMHGFCLTSAPRDLIFEDIPLAINVLGVTHLDLTPSLARLLTPEMVPGLAKGMFITGGEALRQDILDTWGEVGAVYNGYGPTEATIGCTMFPRCPANGKPANIGPQFQNVGSFVVKREADEPVLRGAVGELVVSGKLVGKGYLNRPKLTQERFPTMHGERVYRTGDLVRMTHDGTFLFLGRADDQVKLRGQRLELSEITEVIKKGVDGIEEAVTLVLKHEKQMKEQLVAFFVPTIEGAKEPMGLIGPAKQACVERLPGYMVPTHFVPVEKLPLSANNKADGKQLAAIYNKLSIDELQKLSSAGQSARTWSEEEKQVVDTLAECMHLPVDDLKMGTNIFELGYDSISVIGLSQKLQSAGFANAKLATVMKNSAIEALVKLLLGNGANSAEKSACGNVVAAQQKIKAFAHRHLSAVAEELCVDASQIENLAPCTAAQEGMVFRFLDSEEALYFSTFEFELNEIVNVEKLEDAWKTVAGKLAVLRMKFVMTDAGVAQVVLKDVALPWLVDKETTAFDKMDKNEALVSPWKVVILNDKKLMRLDIFHGLYDGVALPLLMQQVADAYNGKEIPAGPSFLSCLPHGPLATGEGAKEFWMKTLENAQHTPLPELPDVEKSDVVLSKTLTGLEHLETIRQRLGVTYQAIVQAAWTVTLQNYLQAATAPTFGVVVSGRSIDFLDAEKIVGPLLNTLVFQVATEQDMTWEELIKKCHEYNTSVLPYQHTALKDVMKWVGEGGDLMDSLFVFQHAEDEVDNGLWTEVEGNPTADYPIAFEATLQPGGELGLAIVGQPAYLNDEVAEKLAKGVEDALKGLKTADQKIVLPASSGSSIAKTKNVASKQDNEADESFQWTSMAETIRAEIASLTKVDATQIQPFTTLFSLGLDSIDMIKLASRLKNNKIKITVSALVNAGCVAKMMKSITSADVAPPKVAVKLEDVEVKLRAALEKEKKIENVDVIEAVLPATPLQEGMVAEMIASSFERYYNHELYKLSPKTDMEKIKAAWETSIAAHPILRTNFVEVEDPSMEVGYAQVVRKYEPGIWQSVNVESTDSIQVAMRKEIATAIEAAKQGKLLQLRDVTHEDGKYYLLSISHALYDGWSLDALHSDVVAAYSGQDIARPSPRNTLEQVVNANGPEAAKYWKTALTGLPRSSFPIKDTKSTTVNREEILSALRLPDLQTFCRKSNISLQTLGQTAWALLLASYLQKLDVAFGVVLSCRDEEEARRTMMPLMNTVAVRTVLSGTASNMLAETQDYNNKMREFQHFPLRKAQALAAAQSGEGGALFDTLFIFQGGKAAGDEDRKLGGDGGKRLYEPVESKSEVEFAVCVEMEIQGGALLWRTACKDAARDKSETKELLEKLDGVLKTLINKKDEEVMKSGAEGISICGLPAFRMPDQGMTSLAQNPIVKRVNTPWTDNEKAIREVLAKVSKTEEEGITRETSIFHLGLDSISAIKLASLLRRQGLHIGVNEIIKNPTVRGITLVIEGHNMEATTPVETEIDAEKTLQESLAHINRAELLKSADIQEQDVDDILPLTAGQLYMAERFALSNGGVFSATFEWSINANFRLDIERLNEAWMNVQVRRPVLRSKIVLGVEKVGGVQIVEKPRTPGKRVVYDEEMAAVDFLDPVRLSVFGGEEEMKTIKLEILHVLYDATSLDRVLSELQMLYHGPTAELPTSVMVASAEWKHFIASSLPPPVKTEQENFWKSYLPIVKQQPTPLESNGRSGKVEVFEPAVEIGDVKAKAKEAGVSVDAYVLAAVSRVWAAHSGLGLGVYMSNRSSDATANLAGPTLNLLPLRIPATEGAINSKLEEAAKQVQSDLGKLGEDSISSTRLQDIFKWTGQSVGCWVNLLKNGEGSTDDASSSTATQKKLLSKSLNTNQMLRPRAEVKEGSSSDQIEEVKPYGKAVDIELRVVNDGRGLDVGVFAGEEILSLDDAEQIIETLQLVLGGN